MVGQIITHYKILDVLGSGGMGIVYKAEDIKLHRIVALKFLPIELTSDETAKKRFIGEAQAASSLQHNNICTIHEIDESENGKFFIAMDYYEGENLKNKISKELLSIDEIINITMQIAKGLNKAHENGIIHRDIKPANIFVTKEGIVKILDFGLAKKADRSQFTTMGVNLGTTDYMSPEQIKGEKIDHRTDIWSLGTVLYEMLTGQQPFQADYEQAIVYLILNQDPEDARKYRTDVPEKLLGILEKLIAKEREDRYENLESMIDDLRDIMVKSDVDTDQFELPAPIPSQSIAVLPFVNLSKDPEQDYFCDGLTEELINALSKISDLRVVARTSAFAFKGGGIDVRKAGRKLDVKTVLEGSVRKSGDKLRITAQLINVMDGYHLWSERYDRELKDLFDIQEEISLSIVEVLKVKLHEVEKEKLLKHFTDNIEAYNLYQQGYYAFNQLDLKLVEKSIEYFKRAIERDPNFATAYAALAGCYILIAYFGAKRSREVKTIVMNYLQKAIEINSNDAAAYHVLAFFKAVIELKHPEAQWAYRHSLELNPNDTMALQNYSINRVSVGQFEYARKLAKRAKIIDPLSDFIELCNNFPDFYTANYDKVLERISKFSEINPPFIWGLWYLWRTYSLIGKKVEAVEVVKKIFSHMGANEIIQAIEQAGPDNAFQTAANILAGIYQQRYSSPYDIAILFSHAGNQEKVLQWLDIAFEELDPKLHFLNVDPEWKDVRDNERFVEYVRKIGLVE